MTPEQKKIYDEVTSTFDKAVAELNANKENDYILYFPASCLGVAFGADQKTFACSPARADSVGNDKMPEEAWAFVPSVVNGAGDKAEVWNRQKAIAHDLANIESARASLLSRLA